MAARRRTKITFKDMDRSRIPDPYSEASILLMLLHQQGKIEEGGEKLKIRRQGGYAAVDIWLALLIFMTTGPLVGIKEPFARVQDHLGALAALAGRRALPRWPRSWRRPRRGRCGPARRRAAPTAGGAPRCDS